MQKLLALLVVLVLATVGQLTGAQLSITSSHSEDTRGRLINSQLESSKSFLASEQAGEFELEAPRERRQIKADALGDLAKQIASTLVPQVVKVLKEMLSPVMQILKTLGLSDGGQPGSSGARAAHAPHQHQDVSQGQQQVEESQVGRQDGQQPQQLANNALQGAGKFFTDVGSQFGFAAGPLFANLGNTLNKVGAGVQDSARASHEQPFDANKLLEGALKGESAELAVKLFKALGTLLEEDVLKGKTGDKRLFTASQHQQQDDQQLQLGRK